MEFGETFKLELLKGIIQGITMVLSIAEVRNIIVVRILGFITFIISFRIVGKIMREAKIYNIFIGSFWGKILYYFISSIVSAVIGYILGNFISYIIIYLLNSAISSLNQFY